MFQNKKLLTYNICNTIITKKSKKIQGTKKTQHLKIKFKRIKKNLKEEYLKEEILNI